MRLAAQILSGQWLGRFDQYTLAKGPGYPLFIAISAASGLPLSLNQALFSILSIIVSTWTVHRITGSYVAAITSFLILIFLPASFDPTWQRVVRDQIYWGQALLFFSIFAVAILAPPIRSSHRLGIAAVAGVILSWTWLTREEGVWLIPGIAVILAGRTIQCRLERWPLRQGLATTVVVGAGFAALHLTFLTANYFVYGSFASIDIKEKNFTAALAALQSIENGGRIAYVPVSDQALRAAAEASPAFRPLATALREGGPLTGYRAPGCPLYPQSCGQFAGGWFIWAFRDAAALNGFYASPTVASDEFGKISSELEQACNSKQLQCRRSIVDLVPAMSFEQWRSLPARLIQALRTMSLVIVPYVELAQPYKDPDVATLNQFWQILNYPKIVPPEAVDAITSGWFHNKSISEWPTIIRVLRNDNSDATFFVRRIASPDLVNAFSDPNAQLNRFNIVHGCPFDCKIVAEFSDGTNIEISPPAGAPGHRIQGLRTLNVDFSVARSHSSAAGPDKRVETARRISNTAFSIYNVLFPAFLGIGLLCYIATLVSAAMRRHLTSAAILASAAWALVIGRICLIALVDASSFPSINMEYLIPATYLAVIAAITSVFPWCPTGKGRIT